MSAAAFFVQSCAAAVVDSRDMKQPLSVTPDTRNHQPTEQPAKDGAEQAAGTTDSVLALPELLHLLHSSDQGLSTSDADAILQTVGPNRIDTAKPKRRIRPGRGASSSSARTLARLRATTRSRPGCPRARDNCLSDGCV